MKVLFIGGTKRGYLTLKALVDSGAQVSGIISLQQDEHEVERYEQPIQALAQSHGIAHYQTKTLKDRDYAALISAEIKPDVAFVVGCRILLPKSIYAIPRIGTLAVHDSLLPEYRGFAPLNWSVINGATQTGVTLFYLDERMDGGDIAGQKTVQIGAAETAAEVYERICDGTLDLVLAAHADLSAGRITRLPQNYDAGSFTCSRTPDDGAIDWNGSTHDIYNRVRALTYPYPGAFTFYRGERLIVWAAQPGDSRDYVGRIAGRVIEVSQVTGHVDVLTGDGILRLLEVELDGKGRLAAAAVIKSVKSSLGFSLLQMLARIDELEQQVQALTRARDEAAKRELGANPSRASENK
ncbi:MAG: methionyl-tRNA formyltransferase [Betaproteobacteria bacterium]